ncbi:MAG TPA: TorF family putative porin [Caldimonas sp.]
MNKTILALGALTALAAIPVVSHAEDASPLSFNVSLVSDYRFRGISQSRLDPALQGGADYAFPNGFYIGTWVSTINWIKDAGKLVTPNIDTGSAPVEMDFYGGYKGEIQKDFTYDIGALQYYYPAEHLSNIPNSFSPNTLEVYGALTYGPATVKYSHSVTRLFGFASSKGSGYLEAAATFDLGDGYSLTPHLGYQRVRHNSDFSYTDYALTGNKDWFGLTFGAALVGTDTKKISGTPAYVSPSGKNLGRTTLVVSVKKTF